MSVETQRTRTWNNIESLDRNFRPLAYAVVGFAHVKGLELLVTDGRRTFLSQGELYAQGRTTPGDIVTHAEPGESYHNYGLAIDFVCIDSHGTPLWSETPWEEIGEFGEGLGLEWGGRWPRPKRDRPHLGLVRTHHTVLKSIADTTGFLPRHWSPAALEIT